MTLQDFLDRWAGFDPDNSEIAATIMAIADAAARLAELIAEGPLAGDLAALVGESADGDGQKALDVHANAVFRDALETAPVDLMASEEEPRPVRLRGGAPIAVTLDPLDGSNNIAVNAPMASIFGLLPVRHAQTEDPFAAFAQPGACQLASGLVLYGPHTALMLTVRAGVVVFALDRRSLTFRLVRDAVFIPEGRAEYAINASNGRHWTAPVREFVAGCVAGRDGPRGQDFNTRWLGCAAAEVFRVLLRGGIYLYPGDARPAYGRGRLRLVYEANPLALLAEEAGGAATDGGRRILDLVPRELHERVPLILGAREEVARATWARKPATAGPTSPLFGTRGLFRTG